MPAAKTKSSKPRKMKKGSAKSRAGRSRSASTAKRNGVNRWSAKVHTESTFPEKGLFNKDASTIARSLASKKTSPKGPASGMRMLNFYINRAGHNLSPLRKKELQRAKTMLSEIIARRSNVA